MIEKFVSYKERNGIIERDRDIWTVKIANGKYYISCNGNPICYGTAQPGMSCERVLRNCSGKQFMKVS